MAEYIPRAYQQYAEEFALSHPKCGLFLGMGLGKTVITLTVLDQLLHDHFEVERVLVIAPKRVAEDTWPNELSKWEHLADLRLSLVVGTAKQRREALNKSADVYVISRDNIVWLVKEYGENWPFDCLVVDELSSFKSSRSKRFKALRKMTPYFKRVIGLTGTPAPRSYEDLWSQIYLLDRGKRLGRTLTEYRSKYFFAINRGFYTQYSLCKSAKKQIDTRLSDLCISMKTEDCLSELVEPLPLIDVTVHMLEAEETLYKTMERDAVINIKNEDIAAFSAAAVTNKLLQLANGAVYDAEGHSYWVHDRKLEALLELVEAAQGDPVLVYYSFKSDLARIQKIMPKARILNTSKDIADWNAGKIPVLLAHPQSAGHGLNLQSGGHIIIWFSLPWSLEAYLQANARLRRMGQQDQVLIYRILTAGTVDERVIQVLSGKNLRQEDLLRALKAKWEGSGL